MLTAISDIGTVESTATKGVSMGKDDFLKLLVAQLENQDPLDPLDNAEFTAQLAQFSSLEQLVDINKNMLGIQALQQLVNNDQALGFIGREVKVVGDQILLSGGPAEAIYSLTNNSSDVRIGIYDAAGDFMRSASLGALSSGEYTYLWDGKNASGAPMPDGTYRFEIAASGDDGPVEAVGYIRGIVDSVSYEDGSPLLYVNGVKINSSQIKEIK